MKKRRWFTALFPAVLGLFPFFNSMGNPHFAAARPVDRLQLIAVGLCWGVTIGLLFGRAKALDE